MLTQLRRFSSSYAAAAASSCSPSCVLKNSSLLQPTASMVGKASRPLHLSHRPKNRSEVRFCTQAADPVTSNYLSVRIHCTKSVSTVLSEALLCFGASSASMDEVRDSENNDEAFITSIFADGQDVHKCIWHASDSIGLNNVPRYEISKGEQSDWMLKLNDTFNPVEVTNDLWIVPEWRTPIDPQATNIILNPGMAFGTGEHPTTKLCLLMLHELIKGGECFLDYGTGSGVLGIAAVKMGAALSVGIDVDPQAVMITRQNITLNEIDPNRMLVYLVPEKNAERKISYDSNINLGKEKFDIVIANILLNPLLVLAEDIVVYGKPGAIIGVSGILSEQVQQIEELYSNYLDHITVSEMDGWACVRGTRKCTSLKPSLN